MKSMLPSGLKALFSGADRSSFADQASEPRGRDCVVVLHGLGRTAKSMKNIQKKLEACGYLVWSKSYPSRDENIVNLADSFLDEGIAYCRAMGVVNIHFVTHSMGGILVRQYLQNHVLDNLGKIIMLAPPNHGSEIADHLQAQFWYEWIMGPAAMELGTGEGSKPNLLQPVQGTIGVIAGSIRFEPWFGWMFDGTHDGKVSVQSARLDEMSDFLVVERGHTFIMRSERVIEQVLFFLHHGRFNRVLRPD